MQAVEEGHAGSYLVQVHAQHMSTLMLLRWNQLNTELSIMACHTNSCLAMKTSNRLTNFSLTTIHKL